MKVLPRPNCHPYSQQRGFTLADMLTSLAIGALLIGIALPPLGDLWQREQRISLTNKTVGALMYAQQQAILGGRNVVVCPSTNGSTCAKEWGTHQLLIYRDHNADGKLTNGTDTLLQNIALEKGWAIRWRAFGNRKRIDYLPSGYLFNQNGTMEICPSKATNTIATVVINRIGRLRQDERAHEESRCSG